MALPVSPPDLDGDQSRTTAVFDERFFWDERLVKNIPPIRTPEPLHSVCTKPAPASANRGMSLGALYTSEYYSTTRRGCKLFFNNMWRYFISPRLTMAYSGLLWLIYRLLPSYFPPTGRQDTFLYPRCVIAPIFRAFVTIP